MKENEVISQQKEEADQSASINDKEDYDFQTKYIIKYYHKKLYENKEALTYFKLTLNLQTNS